jgi:hypothetical protein
MKAVAAVAAHLVRVTAAGLVLAFQALAVEAAVLGRLVTMHPALAVLLAQMVALVLRHQSQAHRLHALAAAVVVATNLLV